jgi:hypothetical protein
MVGEGMWGVKMHGSCLMMVYTSQEEEKLHSLVNSSSLCSSSNGSLSSGVTSGYNSSPALSGQLPSPEGVVSGRDVGNRPGARTLK